MTALTAHGKLTIFQACAFDDTRLSPQHVMLLGLLANSEDEDGWIRYPNYRRLSQRNPRGVEAAVQVLIDAGYVIAAIEIPYGRPPRTIYRIDRESDLVPVVEGTRPLRAWGRHKQRIPATLRLAVFERDGFRCQECGAVDDLTADHIYPESKGGVTAYHNLQTLCRPCNSRKGARS